MTPHSHKHNGNNNNQKIKPTTASVAISLKHTANHFITKKGEMILKLHRATYGHTESIVNYPFHNYILLKRCVITAYSPKHKACFSTGLNRPSSDRILLFVYGCMDVYVKGCGGLLFVFFKFRELTFALILPTVPIISPRWRKYICLRLDNISLLFPLICCTHRISSF